MIKKLALLGTHVLALAIGFAAGIYTLPILIAPDAPADEVVQAVAERSNFTGEFRRDLADSDALHWGEGTVYVTDDTIALDGKLAPGPDYRLYLSKEFVETEADFERLKSEMTVVGSIKTFDNFEISVSSDIDVADYTSVIVWCESFGEFITAASYQ
ncbi:MAG: DM13 domain-containing protein [Woeseiaceae bacterium]|nr:DM13 domain-containing protein [Woeseiaceae bacterium]